MSFPNTAQRADWYAANHEAAHDLDARYGTGHRPTYAHVGAGFVAACGCPDTHCTRADDPMLHPTWDAALDAARTNLAAAEHGPRAGEETT